MLPDTVTHYGVLVCTATHGCALRGITVYCDVLLITTVYYSVPRDIQALCNLLRLGGQRLADIALGARRPKSSFAWALSGARPKAARELSAASMGVAYMIAHLVGPTSFGNGFPSSNAIDAYGVSIESGCVTMHYCVLRGTTVYYDVLLCTTASLRNSYGVGSRCITRHDDVLRDTTSCYEVLHCTTRCYQIERGTALYCEVPRCTTRHHVVARGLTLYHDLPGLAAHIQFSLGRPYGPGAYPTHY